MRSSKKRKPLPAPPIIVAKSLVAPNALLAGLTPAKTSDKRAVRELTIEALRQLGGVAYLIALGREHPQLFVALLGRVLPLQVQGDPDKPIHYEIVHTFESNI